jgi:uncharacterized protein YcaQ
VDDRPVHRTTFLSPFDGLIHDRRRTEALFGFHYRIAIYTPKEQRTHGYYPLPILHRDRLVGRIDLENDRRHGVLRVNAAYWEDGPVPVEKPLASLARFLGTKEVAWR